MQLKVPCVAYYRRNFIKFYYLNLKIKSISMQKPTITEIVFYGAKFEVELISHYLSLAELLLLDRNANHIKLNFVVLRHSRVLAAHAHIFLSLF